MKFYCNGCKTEINLKEDRLAGRYVYECSCCKRNLRKSDMINEAQIERKLSQKKVELETPLEDMDDYGRYQEEYDNLINI